MILLIKGSVANKQLINNKTGTENGPSVICDAGELDNLFVIKAANLNKLPATAPKFSCIISKGEIIVNSPAYILKETRGTTKMFPNQENGEKV